MEPGEYRTGLEALRDRKPVSIVSRLSVIARLQDLWVDKPADREAPHAEPDTASAALRREKFLLVGSTRGRSDLQEGNHRDDRFAILHDATSGWHVLMVADGAVSAQLGRQGSRVACEAAPGALAPPTAHDYPITTRRLSS